MSIEVRELVIKATVKQEVAQGNNPASPSPSNNSTSPSEEVITICVEKALEILKDKHER
jgi:Family of unknown function (DUF5908)